MKIGIIGAGYWGPNLIRNFHSIKEVASITVCDFDEERLEYIKSKFPNITTELDYKKLLDKNIDAVVVATPVGSHYQIAKEALLSGKHIWVEKPFTAKSNHAEELIKIAEENDLRLFVDHTFLYTGAVRKMKEIISNGELGNIIYFDSVRINLGLFQHDVDVIWDLAPHDLAILFHINEERPNAVTANGVDHLNNGLVDVAYLTLHYNTNFENEWKIDLDFVLLISQPHFGQIRSKCLTLNPVQGPSLLVPI